MVAALVCNRAFTEGLYPPVHPNGHLWITVLACLLQCAIMDMQLGRLAKNPTVFLPGVFCFSELNAINEKKSGGLPFVIGFDCFWWCVLHTRVRLDSDSIIAKAKSTSTPQKWISCGEKKSQVWGATWRRIGGLLQHVGGNYSRLRWDWFWFRNWGERFATPRVGTPVLANASRCDKKMAVGTKHLCLSLHSTFLLFKGLHRIEPSCGHLFALYHRLECDIIESRQRLLMGNHNG